MADRLKLPYTRTDTICNFCAVYQIRNQAICHRNPKKEDTRSMQDAKSSEIVDGSIMSCRVPIEQGVEK